MKTCEELQKMVNKFFSEFESKEKRKKKKRKKLKYSMGKIFIFFKNWFLFRKM